VFYERTVIFGTDYQGLQASCSSNNLAVQMSTYSYLHVPGVDLAYSQEDIHVCWEGPLTGNTAYTIQLPASCRGRYVFIQPRDAGFLWIDDIKVYAPAPSTTSASHRLLWAQQETCVARESDSTSCPGLCVAPAGFQATASGANVEACPANLYQDGLGVHCTPCPAPSTFTAHGGLASVAECECTAGHSRVGGVCVACDAGSYKAAPGDGTCVTCATDTTTQETASVSVNECVCDAAFELLNGVCWRCVAPAAKHHPGNEACIDYGVGSALDPAEPHNRTSCECQAGHASDWPGCQACAVGYYKSGVGDYPCVVCAGHATTVQPASASIAACFCSPIDM